MSAEGAGNDAERAVGRLREMCIDLRACAILDAAGEVLAASGPGEWGSRAGELWRAAAVPGRPDPSQIHVATEDGEVFAVRSAFASAVAVTDRFALASLMLCDLRAVLRDLEPDRAVAPEPG